MVNRSVFGTFGEWLLMCFLGGAATQLRWWTAGLSRRPPGLSLGSHQVNLNFQLSNAAYTCNSALSGPRDQKIQGGEPQ